MTALALAKQREDYTHPEKIYKNLIFTPDGNPHGELRRKFADMDWWFLNPMHIHEELCWLCGWNNHQQVWASYGSRIRIFHTRANVGIWEVGSRWLIRDQPNDASLGTDFITQEFLRYHEPKLNIPLIKEMRQLSAPTDKVNITLMSRAQGVGLNTIWDSLSSDQKTNYRKQLSSAIKEWRQFTSPVAQNVDGSVVWDTIVGTCGRRHVPTCTSMGRTRDEWFRNLEPTLRRGLSRKHKTDDPLVIEEKLQELIKSFPKSEPYVLTHGDLNFTNIIVKDDKIEAIIDWEWAGYLPWWWERCLSIFGSTHQTEEVVNLLWEEMDGELDNSTFDREVMEGVCAAMEIWEYTRREWDHTNEFEEWKRPGFCECKPYWGRFRWEQIGNFQSHKLRKPSP